MMMDYSLVEKTVKVEATYKDRVLKVNMAKTKEGSAKTDARR
jgi:hypothetical protein